jgi:hypothetical protein
MPIRRMSVNTFSSKISSADVNGRSSSFILEESLINSAFPINYYVDNFTGKGGWIDTSGSWNVLNNTISTGTAASNYPISLNYDLRSQNINASINVNNAGAGIVFWYVDSNNWWAAFPFYDSESETFGTGSFTCNCRCCARTDTITGLTCPSTSFAGPGCWSGTQQGTYNTSIGPCGSGGALGTSGACPTGTTHFQGNGTCWRNVSSQPTNCNCQECQSTRLRYFFRMRLIRRLSGTITTIDTQQVTNNLTDSIDLNRVVVRVVSNLITITPFANTTQLAGQISHNASNPLRGYGNGVIFAPTTRRADSTMSNYSISGIYS